MAPNSLKQISVLFIFLFMLVSTLCPAGEREPELVSDFEMIFSAIAAVDGIRLVKAEDVSGNVYTEDCGPSQVLEIIRPNQGPIHIGRLTTSCACLQATMAKREYGQGERAFIEVRNVKPTVPDGATYLVFAQLAAPYKETLQFELFAKSDRNLNKGKTSQVAQPVPAQQQPASPRQSAPFRAPGFGSAAPHNIQ